MDIQYHKLNYNDFDNLTALLKVYEEVFEVRDYVIPERRYLKGLLQDKRMFFFAAFFEGQVVGGLTAHILPSVYFPSGEVYIYDLAVKTEFQRKGIGRQLLESLKTHCIDLNLKEIFVQADWEDFHALDFYKATGGVPEKVVHFSYSLEKKTNKS